MIVRLLPSKILRPVLIASLTTFVSCVEDKGDSTTVSVPPAPTEENTTNGTSGDGGNGGNGGNGTTVNVKVSSSAKVNNKIDNDVRVKSSTKVEKENNNIIFVWRVQNADPVIHQQWIHKSDRCTTLIQDDTNSDGFIDEQELQQTVGTRLIPLQVDAQYPNGASYTYTRSIPLDELWQSVSPGESFVVVYYGVSTSFVLPTTYLTVSEGPAHLNVPVFCVEYQSPQAITSETTNDETTETAEGNGTTGTTDDEATVIDNP